MNDKLRKKLTGQQEQIKGICNSILEENARVAEKLMIDAYKNLYNVDLQYYSGVRVGVIQMANAIIKEIEAEKQKGREK